MTNRKVARVELDRADKPIASGANTVFTNNKKTAHAGSVTVGGATVIQGATTVFVENKPIARAGDDTTKIPVQTGSTNVFASDIKAAKVNVAAVKNLQSTTNKYQGNPSQYSNAGAAEVGAKQYYPPQPSAPISDESGEPLKGIKGDIPTFLASQLAAGGWRETGQGGKPSNPKIVNIWTELGFPGNSPWTSDQTAWCAGFVNWTLKKAGYRWAPEAMARAVQMNPKRWKATPVAVSQMEPGDMVLWNIGHLNFCYTANNGKYTFVGGNQTPKDTNNKNPNDGDLTISYPGGWSPERGGIAGVFRPSKD